MPRECQPTNRQRLAIALTLAFATSACASTITTTSATTSAAASAAEQHSTKETPAADATTHTARLNDAPVATEADYTRVCGICHLPAGQGVPGAFPPLDKRLEEYASNVAGRTFLVGVLQNGLYGTIEVNGTTYSGAMPPVSGQLDDAGMAGMLNYVITRFGGADEQLHFTEQEISQRKAGIGSTSGAELRKALQL